MRALPPQNTQAVLLNSLMRHRVHRLHRPKLSERVEPTPPPCSLIAPFLSLSPAQICKPGLRPANLFRC